MSHAVSDNVPRENKRAGELNGGTLARQRYQKGSVFLRGKRRVWVGRWLEDRIKEGGEKRRVYCSEVLGTRAELPTKHLAQRRLELILSRINSPLYRPGRVATISEFAERWEREVLVHRKPSTVHGMKGNLRCHILPRLGKLNLDSIGPEAQQVFASALCEKLAIKSVRNILGTLSTMLSTAKRWGYITQTVKLNELVLPERAKKLPCFFSPEETRQIIGAAAGPFRSMFATAAMTGIRAGELMGLQIEDLDFARRLIYVRRSAWRGKLGTTKSAASRAPLPMPEPLAMILQEHLKTWHSNPDRLLFANKLGRPFKGDKVVQKQLWPILDMLKLPRCGLHAFRHTHTSVLLDIGAPPTVAQAQLRHASPKTTLEIYGHIIGDAQRKAVERVADILHPNRPTPAESGKWIH